jgi:hypothetical protein
VGDEEAADRHPDVGASPARNTLGFPNDEVSISFNRLLQDMMTAAHIPDVNAAAVRSWWRG